MFVLTMFYCIFGFGKKFKNTNFDHVEKKEIHLLQ